MHPQLSEEVKAKVRRINARLDPLALADKVVLLQRKLLRLAEDLRLQGLARESPG